MRVVRMHKGTIKDQRQYRRLQSGKRQKIDRKIRRKLCATDFHTRTPDRIFVPDELEYPEFNSAGTKVTQPAKKKRRSKEPTIPKLELSQRPPHLPGLMSIGGNIPPLFVLGANKEEVEMEMEDDTIVHILKNIQETVDDATIMAMMRNLRVTS